MMALKEWPIMLDVGIIISLCNSNFSFLRFKATLLGHYCALSRCKYTSKG